MTNILKDLHQFTGTETWYRHWLNRTITYTDGVKYVADQASAYWLIDEIVIAQRYVDAVAKEPFQFWRLKVNDNDSAALTCEDGNERVVWRKDITLTDFPRQGVTFYVTDSVILLPSEY